MISSVELENTQPEFLQFGGKKRGPKKHHKKSSKKHHKKSTKKHHKKSKKSKRAKRSRKH
jgi:hypothetical protein